MRRARTGTSGCYRSARERGCRKNAERSGAEKNRTKIQDHPAGVRAAIAHAHGYFSDCGKLDPRTGRLCHQSWSLGSKTVFTKSAKRLSRFDGPDEPAPAECRTGTVQNCWRNGPVRRMTTKRLILCCRIYGRRSTAAESCGFRSGPR